MYFDLFLPFPTPQVDAPPKKKKDKSKGKAKADEPSSGPKSCWDGLEKENRERFAESIALSGHCTSKSSSHLGDPPRVPMSCSLLSPWQPFERDSELTRTVVGYSVVGCTVTDSSPSTVRPSPFRPGLPYPNLDPRFRAHPEKKGESSSEQTGAGLTMVQVSRYHIRLDDSKSHCLVGAPSRSLIR